MGALALATEAVAVMSQAAQRADLQAQFDLCHQILTQRRTNAYSLLSRFKFDSIEPLIEECAQERREWRETMAELMTP